MLLLNHLNEIVVVELVLIVLVEELKDLFSLLHGEIDLQLFESLAELLVGDRTIVVDVERLKNRFNLDVFSGVNFLLDLLQNVSDLVLVGFLPQQGNFEFLL